MSSPAADRQDIALFPLSTVLFPGGQLPLQIFEARYVDMVSTCMRENQPFGVVPIAAGSEVGRGAEFYPHGTLAKIISWDQGANQLLHIVTEGSLRFDVLEHSVNTDGLTRGEVTLRERDVGAIAERHKPLVRLLEEAYDAQPKLALPQPWALDDSAWVAYRLAELMPLPTGLKLEILLLETGEQKLDRVGDLLTPPST